MERWLTYLGALLPMSTGLATQAFSAAAPDPAIDTPSHKASDDDAQSEIEETSITDESPLPNASGTSGESIPEAKNTDVDDHSGGGANSEAATHSNAMSGLFADASTGSEQDPGAFISYSGALDGSVGYGGVAVASQDESQKTSEVTDSEATNVQEGTGEPSTSDGIEMIAHGDKDISADWPIVDGASMQQETSATEPDLSDNDSMMVLLSGYASAAGGDGQTSGDFVFDIVDYGNMTVGYGYTTFAATGFYGDEQGPVAATAADVSGADFVYMVTFDQQFISQTTGMVTDTSTTYVLAIDFESDVEGSPEAVQYVPDEGFPIDIMYFLDQDRGQGVDIDGNAASLVFNAVASDDSLNNAVVVSDTNATEDTNSNIDFNFTSDPADLSIDVNASGIDTFASAEGSLITNDSYTVLTGGVIIGA